MFLDEAALQANVDQVALASPGPLTVEFVQWNSLLETLSERPSFAVPASSLQEGATVFRDPIGVAGFGTLRDVRQAVFTSDAAFDRIDGTWRRNASRLGAFSQEGDSGGPLFTLHAGSGTRDPFGIDSASVAVTQDFETTFFNVWADITRPEIAQWIRDNARDARRSPAWLARHGRRDLWVGEVDYTGPCDTVRDADCDHWYAWHDNCPADYNPGQHDVDDDGLGDVCDNCVHAANQGQENCNLLSERTNAPNKPPLGDACDPVPCPQSDFGLARFVKACVANPPGPNLSDPLK